MPEQSKDTGRRFRREPSEVTFGERIEPPKEDPFLGKLYGKWKLMERIGVGGVGFVYLGRNTENAKTAAIKLLHSLPLSSF